MAMPGGDPSRVSLKVPIFEYSMSYFRFGDAPFFFACDRSEPATDFTSLLLLGLRSSLLALLASFFEVVIVVAPKMWNG